MYYEMFRLWEKIESLPDVDLFFTKGHKYEWSPARAAAAAACSRFMNVLNGSGTCLFGALLGVERLPLFEWLDAATGWHRTPAEYLAIGDRIQTMKQVFNLKQGLDPRTFKASARTLGIPPLAAGANKGRRVALERMRRDYWQALGWDPQTGVPRPETLQQFDLTFPEMGSDDV
jgi:aldehyde:ferredoxin oxidoreductase